jgi:gliding motility-associated-like protein
LIFVLSLAYVNGQASYNNCSDALELCPGVTQTVNNIDANSFTCANCEDDFSFCFNGENTVWFTFTTDDDGGDLDVDFSNLTFENLPGQGSALQATVLETVVPCVSSSYNVVSNCENNSAANFTLSAIGLNPGTTYFVVVNGEMGATDNAEATFDIEINGTGVDRNPTFAIGASPTTICEGEQVFLFASVERCDDQSVIDWYANGDLLGSTVDTFFVTQDISDGDQITATITCFDQCPLELTSNQIGMTVISFDVDAGPDLVIEQGESTQLQGSTSETGFVWSPAVNMNDPSLLNPVVNPNQTITYFLTADNGTCTITDEMVVTVNSGLVIPNTFSPNGDGINDTWEILGIEKYPDANVQVYNRWGQLIFQTTGYPPSKRWNGTSKSGKSLAASAYYYVINVRNDDFEEPLKGHVTILE